MKQLFEEYGSVVLAVVAVTLIFALLFVRFDFMNILREAADVDSDVTHQHGQSALKEVVKRTKPVAVFDGVNLHIYKNQAFQPLRGVAFQDAEGEDAEVVITSILYCGADGATTELIGFYDSTKDVIVLNPQHYSETHMSCTTSEFSINSDGLLLIGSEAEQNTPGLVTVTYRATDDERQVTEEKLTFVIDGKEAQHAVAG